MYLHFRVCVFAETMHCQKTSLHCDVKRCLPKTMFSRNAVCYGIMFIPTVGWLDCTHSNLVSHIDTRECAQHRSRATDPNLNRSVDQFLTATQKLHREYFDLTMFRLSILGWGSSCRKDGVLCMQGSILAKALLHKSRVLDTGSDCKIRRKKNHCASNTSTSCTRKGCKA